MTSSRRIASYSLREDFGHGVLTPAIRKFHSPPASKFRAAANDNNPQRVTRLTAYNGGCSTTSGMIPVTLARVSSIDGVAA